jgi:predicted Fe-Mo cluster-binding NifX family protein
MQDQGQIIRLAVPSDEPGGLDAARSGHFKRSPSFTIVDLSDDVVVSLGENFVDVVIVAGIGRTALLHCVQAGMRVLAGEDRPTVRSVVEAYIDADLVPVGHDATALH